MMTVAAGRQQWFHQSLQIQDKSQDDKALRRVPVTKVPSTLLDIKVNAKFEA